MAKSTFTPLELAQADRVNWKHTHDPIVMREGCLKCGLHANCKTPWLRPQEDTRLFAKGKGLIMIISDHPDISDNKDGQYYARGFAQLRDQVLANLDSEYIWTTVARCGVPHGQTHKESQYRTCYDTFLRDDIVNKRPRAIVAMGNRALQALFPGAGYKFTDVKGMYIYDETLNLRVYVAEHNAQLLRKEVNLEALGQHWYQVFSQADAYVQGEPVREQIAWSSVTTPSAVLDLARRLPKVFACDVETNYPIKDKRGTKDPSRNSVHKENAKCITISITYKEGSSYTNRVLYGPALEDPVALSRLFLDREPVFHNALFDIQAIKALCKVDIFDYCKRHHDTQLPFYISDQNRLSTSLKNLARQYLENVGDWETESYREVVKVSAGIEKRRKEISAELKRLSRFRQNYKELCRIYNLEVLSVKEKNFAKRVLDEWKDLGVQDITQVDSRMDQLREEEKHLPPSGLASYADIPISKLACYNAEDTLRTLQLFYEVIPYLEKVDGFTYDKDCYEMMIEFQRTLCKINQTGILIDMKALDELEAEINEEISQLQQLIKTSPKAMEAAAACPKGREALAKGKEIPYAEILSCKNQGFMAALADQFGVKPLGNRTEKGNITYGKLVLPSIIKYLNKRGNTEGVLVYDALDKLRFSQDLKSKFIDNWRIWVCPDSCFHPDYKLVANGNLGYVRGKDAKGGAQSGRLSATRINAQQIFKLYRLRKVFVAPPGFFIAELDYKSLEPMLMAFVTGCERLKEVFRRGLDLYRFTCNDIYEKGVNIDQPDEIVRQQLNDPNLIPDEERKKFKAGFLSWVYGTGIKKFAELLKISEDEARRFFSRASEIYHEIFEYKKQIQEMVDEGRPLYSYTKRRRTFPVTPPQDDSFEERERYRKDRSKAFRVAVNAGIQVLGSDITMMAASRIQRWIEANHYENVVKIFNPVHDSLWFYIAKSHAHLYWTLKAMMEDLSHLPFKMDVALVVEGTVGYHLGQSMGLDDQKAEQIQLMEELGITASKPPPDSS